MDSDYRAVRPTASASESFNLERHISELNRLKSDEALKLARIVVVVMGPTGAGKSRFITEATGLDVEVGDSLHSSEQPHSQSIPETVHLTVQPLLKSEPTTPALPRIMSLL